MHHLHSNRSNKSVIDSHLFTSADILTVQFKRHRTRLTKFFHNQYLPSFKDSIFLKKIGANSKITNKAKISPTVTRINEYLSPRFILSLDRLWKVIITPD